MGGAEVARFLEEVPSEWKPVRGETRGIFRSRKKAGPHSCASHLPVQNRGQRSKAMGDVVFGGLASERKSNRAGRVFRSDAHGEEDMGGLHGTDHTGGPAGGANAFEIQPDQERLAVGAGEADVESIGKRAVGSPIADGGGGDFLNPVPEGIPEGGEAGGFPGAFFHGHLGRSGHASDGGDIFRSRTAGVLMRASMGEAGNRDPGPKGQESNPLGTAEFVGSDG